MSATSMTVGNLRLETLIDLGGFDNSWQQLQSRIKQLESATKIKISIDTSALDGGITKATQQLQNLQRIASAPTVLKVDSAQVTAATAAVTNHVTAQKSAQTEITKTTQAVQQHSAAHASLQSAIGGTSTLVQSLTMNMGGLGQGIQQATMAASGFSGPLAALGIGLGVVAVGLGASVKAAVDFQTTVVQVANNTQMTNAELATMQEGVKQLALVIPASTTAMANGWRHAADEGFNAADSLKIVNAASMAAVNTGAQVTDTIFLVAQALHAYHEPATDAMLVTNQLVEASKQGNTTFAQMAQSIGPLIAQAASLHIPLADIVGAMSAMTQNGYPADQAVTGLTNLLKEVEAPSDRAKAAIAALGDRGKLLIDDFTPAGLSIKGLHGVMKDLGTATDGDNAKILAILPQLRGFRSGVVLAGTGLDDYTKAMNTQADVMSGKLKPTQEDFARTMETVGAKMQILKNTVEVLAIDLGTIFLPILTKVVQGIIDFAQSIGLLSGASGFKDVKKQIQDVNDSYAQTKTAQDAVAAANVTSGNTAAAAGVKSADAAQAHTDALANVKTAAGALDQALGFPNGQKGIQETVANLGTLETTAKDQAARAVSAVNDALSLPNGSIGPKDAADFLGELKDAGAAATQVIQGLNAELAANKALLDQNAAAIQNVKNTYDPIIKSAEQHIRDINLLSPEELARKQRELELDKEKANLELTKPNTSVFDTAIATDKTSLDAMPRLDTGKWDDAIKADDKNLKSFDVSSYTAATQKQIDTLQDTDVAAPFKKQAQDIQDAMAALDPEAATKSITDTINSIRDKSAALDPEAATRPFNAAIQSIRDSMSALDPEAATRPFNDAIAGIRDSMASLDPEAATRGITDTISGINDAIHGLNTDALDQKINSIKDILVEPAPNTTGISDQIVALNAGRQAPGADQAGITSRVDALNAQRTGILAKHRDDTTGLTGQLHLLERQRADQKTAQAETKRADEVRIVDLTRQATAIKEGIADTKAADAARIVDLTRQAQAIKEGITDTKRADEARIVDLTRQAAQIKEGITDQKAADAARIVQLTRQAQTIKEGIADERKADETKLRGIARDQAAAEKTKATSLATLADTLKGEQATAAADKKKIDTDRAWNQEQKTNAVDLDRDARQKLTDDITHQERLKTAMLLPYTQQLAGITAQQQHNSLLDAADAAARKITLAPYLAQLDQAKQKEADELAPLLAKKQELDGIKSKLDEEKATWGGIKSAIDSAKSSLDNYFKLPTGGGSAGTKPGPDRNDRQFGKTNTAGASSALTGTAAFADAGGTGVDTGLVANVPKSPIQIQMEGLKTWLDTNIPDMLKKLTLEAKLDLASVFEGVDFVKNVAEVLSDLEQHKYGDAWAAARRLVGGGATGNDGSFIGPPVPPGYGGQSGPIPGIVSPIPGFSPSFPRAGAPSQSEMDNAGQDIANAGKRLGSWFKDHFGGQNVGASDLSGQIGEIDQFTQHIQDSLGDSGGAQAAIQSFKDQITREMGQGSDAATAVADAEKSFMDTFGSGNAVPTSFTDTGTAAQQTFGSGGDVATAFAQNDNGVVDTTRTLDTAAGSWGDAYAQTGQDATKHLGAGGTVDTAYTNATTGTTDLVGTLDNATTKMGGAYGTTANAATKNLGKGGVADTANTDLVSSLDNASQQGQGALTTLNGGVTGTATNATSQFGPNGPTDAAHKNLTTSIQSAQTNGTTALGTLDSSVTGTANNATTQFGANGTTDRATRNLAASMNTSQTQADGSLALLDNAVSGTANGVGTNLGAGGATDRHLGSFGNTTSTTASGAVGAFGTIDAAVLATGGPAGSIISNLTVAGNWLQTTWQGISSDIAKPFTDAWPAIDGFFKSLSTGLEWLAGNFKLSFVKYQGADTGFIGPLPPAGGAPSGGASPKASGDMNFQGGAALIGEGARGDGTNGRELFHDGSGWKLASQPTLLNLPRGSTVLPNHITEQVLRGGVPGFADGLNMDGLLAGMGGALAHNGDKLIDGMMGALGTPTIPGIEGAGAALGMQLTAGLHEWMKASSVQNAPTTTSGHGSGSGQGVLGGTSAISQDAVRAMTAFADSVAGQGYVWGGGHGNNNGYDCSGFVAAVLDAGGISNPHGIVTDFANWMDPGRTGVTDIGVFNPNGAPDHQHMGIGLNGQWYEMGGRVPGPPGYTSGAGKTDDYFPIIGHPPGSFAAQVATARGVPSDLSAVQQYIINPAVVGWLQDALAIDSAPPDWLPAMIIAAAGESSDTPNAQNNWDSNAAAGHPSQGLLQVIDSTFAANMASGHGDIWNPVDNAAASINYIRARYGSPWNLAGVNAVQQSGDIHSWIGYAEGGYFPANNPALAMIGEGAHDEVVAPVPMLREIVRQESGVGSGGPPTVILQPGAIIIQKDGTATVDPSRISFVTAARNTGRAG